MDTRFPIRALALAGATLLPAAAPSAQALHFLAPVKAADREPGGLFGDRAPQAHMFWGSTGADRASRVQYVHDVDALTVKLAFVTALEVRPDHTVEQLAASFRTRIRMSMGPNGSLGASPSFAANLGSDVKLVFDGRVDLPATDTTSWPAAWAVKLPMKEPFVFLKIRGKSYVVDVESEGLSGRPWLVEGYRMELGRVDVEHYALGCRPKAGGMPHLLGKGELALPGQGIDVVFSGLPLGQETMRLNAFYMGNGGRGTNFNGMRTPIDLGSLGVPTHPGCQWVVGQAVQPMTLAYEPDGRGGAQLRLPGRIGIPPYAFMVGKEVFGQAVAVDGSRLFTTPAYKWTVGSGALVPASSVRATFDPARPVAQGQVLLSETATLRLTH